MAMQLSIRIKSSKQSRGQAGHDFDGRPVYADPKLKHLNKTIVGGTEAEIKALIERQSKSIKARFNDKAAGRRFLCLVPKELQKIGSWRKTTATHKKSIITFNKDFRANDNNEKIDRERLDQCALKFYTELCREQGCELTYIVRHDDETTAHYHGMFTNVNEETLKPLKFQMQDLSDLQTRAGEAFAPLGIERGTMRGVRRAMARVENPQHEGESERDYNKRITKISNTGNRGVAKLHDEQEADFKAQIEDLENEINVLNNKVNKVRKNVSTAELKLESTNIEDVDVRNKIEKNLATYSRRERKLSTDLSMAQLTLNNLNSAQANASKDIEFLKIQMVELQQKNSALSKSNELLEKKLQTNSDQLSHAIKQIEHLSKDELPKDISKTYQIKDGVFGYKEMKLISPKKYYKYEKPLQAHRLKNKTEETRLSELNQRLGRKETELKKRVSNFENEVAAGVRDKIQLMSAQLKPEIAREMVNKISAVANEVYRMKQKHNIHQGFGTGHSLNDKQELELRAAMNSAVGREYIEGIIDYTKNKAIQAVVDSKFDSETNLSNNFGLR